jgi:protein Mpv17
MSVSEERDEEMKLRDVREGEVTPCIVFSGRLGLGEMVYLHSFISCPSIHHSRQAWAVHDFVPKDLRSTTLHHRVMTTSAQLSDPSSLWDSYNSHLVTHPILTKALTAAFLSMVADLICQYFTKPPGTPYEGGTITHKHNKINWRRTFNWAAISFFVFAPLSHYWYGFLSTKISGDSFFSVAQRVLLDQFLYSPFAVIFTFAATLFLEGKKELIPNKIRQDLVSTLITNYFVWIPAQLINFSVIPPTFRVLWANLIGFFWSIYLSNVANKTSNNSPNNKVLAEGKHPMRNIAPVYHKDEKSQINTNPKETSF